MFRCCHPCRGGHWRETDHWPVGTTAEIGVQPVQWCLGGCVTVHWWCRHVSGTFVRRFLDWFAA